MHLLLVSHLLGRYMILVIFPTPVEPLLVPLPEVVVYSLIKVKAVPLEGIAPTGQGPGIERIVS